MAQHPPSIPAPDRIFSKPNAEGAGRLLYGKGDSVPYDEAVKLGLVKKETAAAKKAAASRSKKGPAEDRSGRPEGDGSE